MAVSTIYNAEGLRLLKRGARRHDDFTTFKHDTYIRVHHFDDLVAKLYEELDQFAVAITPTLQSTLTAGSTYTGAANVSITSAQINLTANLISVTQGNASLSLPGDDSIKISSQGDQYIHLGSGTSMIVKDGLSSKGLEYFTDYSGAFTTNSLVSKLYVDTTTAAHNLQGVLDAGSTATMSSGGFQVQVENTATDYSRVTVLDYEATIYSQLSATQTSIVQAANGISKLQAIDSSNNVEVNASGASGQLSLLIEDGVNTNNVDLTATTTYLSTIVGIGTAADTADQLRILASDANRDIGINLFQSSVTTSTNATGIEVTVNGANTGTSIGGKFDVNTATGNNVGVIGEAASGTTNVGVVGTEAGGGYGTSWFAKFGVSMTSAGITADGKTLGIAGLAQTGGVTNSIASMMRTEAPSTVTNAYVYYSDGVHETGAGTVTNGYGFYLAANSGAITNSYGIYQAGASDLNYFAGNIGVGIAPDSQINVYARTTSAIELFKAESIGGGCFYRGEGRTESSDSLTGTSMTVASVGASATGNLYGHDLRMDIDNAVRTIDKVYGFYLENMSTNLNATVNNLYQVYLGTHGNATKGTGDFYGIYQADSTLKNYFAGNVGIGTTPDAARELNVASTLGTTIYSNNTGNNSTNTGIRSEMTTGASNANAYGVYSDVDTTAGGNSYGGFFQAKGSASAAIGSYSKVGGGNVTGLSYGAYNLVLIDGASTTGSTMYGSLNVVTVSTTGTHGSTIIGSGVDLNYTKVGGTLTSAFGFYSTGIVANDPGATISSAYGLYLGDNAGAGTITNSYGVYQVGADDQNYFAGNVGIGMTPVAGSVLSIATTTNNLEFIESVYNTGLSTAASTLDGYIKVEIGGNVMYLNAYSDIPT